MIAPRSSRLSDHVFTPSSSVRPNVLGSFHSGLNRSRWTSPGAGVSPRRVVLLRTLFGLDVIGAGGPGLLLLFAPRRAGEWLFAGQLTPDAGTVVLGCVWLAIGLLAIAGLYRPIAFCGVLILQMIYKLIWLAGFGIPALLSGESVPAVLAIIFAAWVAAVGLVVPWRVMWRDTRAERDSH